MTKETIIITAVAGDIGASAVKALHGCDKGIIGTDTKDFSPIEELLDGFLSVPPATKEEEYIDALSKIAQQFNSQYILPISEPEIEVIARNRDVFDKRDIKILVNNELILMHFLDKLKTAQFLKSIGVAVPDTMKLKDIESSFPFPAIVKARRGCGSKRQWLVENENDLEYVRRRDSGELVIQEYIGTPDEEYTTGVFSDGNKISSITFRRTLGFGGLSVEAEYVESPFMEDLAENVAVSTKMIGSINIQTRKVGKIHVPFEINPRLSSTLLFRKQFGFDDVKWWVDALAGKGYSYSKRYRAGKAIRCLEERYTKMEVLSEDSNGKEQNMSLFQQTGKKY